MNLFIWIIAGFNFFALLGAAVGAAACLALGNVLHKRFHI